jgi:tripartite ATP-independent transporter DctM subunit
MLQGANEEAGLLSGNLAPLPVTAIDLFAGALLPGLLLVGFFILYILIIAKIKPQDLPIIATNKSKNQIIKNFFIDLLPPIILILSVLGSIFLGVATPTESAAVGAAGALIISFLKRQLDIKKIIEASITTVKMSSFVFMILIGASMFSLVFRGFGGDDIISDFLKNTPGGKYTALFIVMMTIFILGFFLDYIEIIFVIIPLVGPGLIASGIDPLWLGILISLNLQTSFLTPPFGFSLFFLRGVAPKEVKTLNIYKGVIPFIFIQVLTILIVFQLPELATWLPRLIN